ncbi:MAG: anthranilate phosphoribosyltransferase [Gemmatimonadetes bacterium]|uniref:Anthranilate phosphoribosyltransferase n=1 Tax=Candidatus Kutchimonas denitrificans TaxID=3056748 RepID=A0AAE4Z7A7_9BACT|nr:anthranilate phosphoribosyltransferase [Gemmatimonadota bacterium]NIR74323.1 anthranilate phosphoribosyltransferase [Candidatus Kutchimonas denitrificans]NIS01379.1 anthranilate phosphoribosyltransferase [Gemmatimonadota bacterium]NIT67119.1 anthranilate phosphoribosyltransferase [Gemmatimonadota bacterium]NIU52775.1 anthranilate phosphoribosyltransferase [Gemmatimonadota bacterium]
MSEKANGELRSTLGQLAQGKDLTREDAAAAMSVIMEGGATPAQIGAFLMGLRAKGETADEITGCAEAIRAKSMPVPHSYPKLLDTCGTGGDGASTFNISTTAAFIAAGAGQKVAKHGNRAISSQTGSADVLEALGVQVDMAGPEAAGALDEVGMTFLFAPTFHSAMRHAAAPRRELGMRSVFNVLGPLCNPAGATAQVMGVFDGDLAPKLARVLGNLGVERALVVHGSDGLDELTITGPSRVAEWTGAEVKEYEVEPEDVGLKRGLLESLKGGDASTNAEILRAVLEGKDGGPRQVALLNAGAALLAAGQAADLREGVERAREAVDSGAALARLELLLDYSRMLREREGGTRRRAEKLEGGIPGWGQS